MIAFDEVQAVDVLLRIATGEIRTGQVKATLIKGAGTASGCDSGWVHLSLSFDLDGSGCLMVRLEVINSGWRKS